MFILRRIYQMYRCFTFALRTYLLCSYNNTGISPMVLVEAKEHPVHPLKLNFCKSLNQGELHLECKCAIVFLIFKKSKQDMPENYRPVSLTSVVGKILEKLIRNALMDYLVSNRLLTNNQFGFVPGRSCALQLLVCMESRTKALDDGAEVDIIHRLLQSL